LLLLLLLVHTLAQCSFFLAAYHAGTASHPEGLSQAAA